MVAGSGGRVMQALRSPQRAFLERYTGGYMATDERRRLAGSAVRVPGVLGRLLAFAVGAVLLIAAFMVSLVVFAIAVAAAVLVGGYLWWKTRELRRRMRERPPGGRVIEGEVMRDDAPDETHPR
jgi:Flp pilus assembly protein TadB